jgi:hypothetical protein
MGNRFGWVRRAVALLTALSVTVGGILNPVLLVQVAHAAAPSALTFNGSNYGEVPDNQRLYLPLAFTIEGWAKPQSAAGYHDIVGKTGYEIAVQSSGSGFIAEMQVSIANVWYTVKSSQVFNYGPWYHVAGTYDGSALHLYVNGVQVASSQLTGDIDPSTHPLRIGSVDGAGGGDLFVGSIDEVRISNVVRYSGTFTPQTTPFQPDVNTAALWHLDEGTGTSIVDASGSNNNGTLIGSPTWGVDSPLPAPIGDTTAPVISAVSATPGDGGASVTWNTDEPATRLVEYGTTTAYGLISELDTTLSKTHQVNLAALTPSTTYNYHVVSQDASGNQSVSPNFTFTTTAAGANAATMGEWGPLMNWPLVDVHMAMLYTGQVMMFDAWEIPGTPSARLWNPSTNTFLPVSMPWSQMFCSGMAILADGQVDIVGGHNGGENGIVDTNLFNPATNLWTRTQDMKYPRWYPSSTMMGDGRVVALSGNISAEKWIDTPEVYSPVTNTWTPIAVNTNDVHEEEYPLSFLMPNGNMLSIAPSAGVTDVLNLNAATWTRAVPGISPVQYGSAIQYRPGKFLFTGGGHPTRSLDSETTAAVLDMTQPTPAWRTVSPMNYGRTYHNLVVLPDGKVFTIGGSSQVLSSPGGPHQSEMWDPTSETFTTMATEANPRQYHSTALLMPDGRVLSAGGGRLPGDAVTVDYPTAEIYSPPYLFKGPRPTITAAPTSFNYGSNFTIQTPDAAGIGSVSLIRLSTNTHTMNDQTYIPVSYTAGASSLTLTAPTDSNVAPAGYYMLFIVNGQGVPSVARILKLSGTSQTVQPPTVSLTAPANAATVSGNTTISASATSTVGISSVQFQLDGSALGTADTTSPYQFAWNTATISNGPHTLGAIATDSLGNSASAGTVSVTVNNPPVISNISSGTPTQTGATITWTTNTPTDSTVNYGLTSAYGQVASSATQVTSQSVTLSGLTTNTPYHFQVKSTDSIGNTATSGDNTFTTAGNAPVTLVGDTKTESFADNNSAGSAEAFQYTATATGAVTQMSVYVDTGNAATKLNVGLYSDKSGVPGSLLTSATITSPKAAAWNTTTVPTASVTSGTKYWIAVLSPSGSGVVHFRDVASGGLTQASSQNNLAALPAAWSAGATYGNSPMSAYAAQAGPPPPPDTTPPTVSMTSPANGASVSGTTVSVAATASDNVGVASVQFTLDGANLGSPIATAPYQVTWDTTAVANGSHTLAAKASDAAGNATTATSVSVNVGNPPTISGTSINNVTATGATVQWTTNEPATSQVLYGLTTSYGSATTQDPSLVTSHSQTLTGLTPNTTYNCQLVSVDSLGNQVTSKNLTFTTATVSATRLLGDATVESGVDNNTAGSAEAFTYTATASGTANQLSVYLDTKNAATSVIVGLYTDNANNPGTLLASGTITAPKAAAWNTVNISNVAVTSGTKYWIAILSPTGAGKVQFRDKASGGARTVASSQSNLTVLPATWTTGAAYANSPMSAYAAEAP